MNAKEFGERVALLRKMRGMTQTQLAEKLNISNKAVSRWETGEGYPEITLLSPLAKALGVSIDQLLAEDTDGFYENTSGKKFYSTSEASKAAARRQKEMKHKEIPVQWPGLGLKDFVKNPYMWSNVLHVLVIAVLTGIVYSSNIYTVDGAGRYTGYVCTEPMGYVVKAVMVLALLVVTLWNLFLVKKQGAAGWFAARNIGISSILVIGFQFGFTYTMQHDVYRTMESGTFFNHDTIVVDRNLILLTSVMCAAVYIASELIRIYRKRKAAASDPFDEPSVNLNEDMKHKFWKSLTIFNKIGWITILICIAGFILSMLLYFTASLIGLGGGVGGITVIHMIAAFIAGSVCSTAAKAGCVVSLIGLGAGLLDCYDRQYHASLMIAAVNIIFAYLLPLLMVFLQFTNLAFGGMKMDTYADVLSML